MIREKELRDFRPDFQYKNGREITLNLVREKLEIAMNNASAPVAFEKDQIKTGGIFNSNTVDCLVMYHPEHTKDYFKFCIYIITMAMMQLFVLGNMGRANRWTRHIEVRLQKRV